MYKCFQQLKPLDISRGFQVFHNILENCIRFTSQMPVDKWMGNKPL